MADQTEKSSAGPTAPATQTPDEKPRPPMTLAWMGVDTEWGMRAQPGPAGLRVGDLLLGSYGELPAVWPDDTMCPRGAASRPDAPRMGYEVSQKSEMWTDNAAALYEEAIQRRWKAATDIDWASIPAGPAELDRARAQLLTIMAEQSWVQSVTYGAWLKRLSYGYYEVKLFLATVVFALGRQTEAFRKRAMLHGGGVGMQGTAGLNREIIDARNFTEMILINQLMADSFMEVLLGRLAADAPSPAEARLYTLARQDRARALAFGQARVRDALTADPARIDEMHGYLQAAEVALTHDLKDRVSNEALAIVLGGDVEAMATGAERLADLRRAQARAYLRRLAAAGIERADRQWPYFAVATGQITKEEMRAARDRKQAEEAAAAAAVEAARGA